MVKPTIPQLNKATQFATAMAAHNELLHEQGLDNSALIKVSQVSRRGFDVLVSLRRHRSFEDEDVKFIMAIASGLNGTVNFKETGEIIVNF